MVSLRYTLIPRLLAIFTIRENFRNIYNPKEDYRHKLAVKTQ